MKTKLSLEQVLYLIKRNILVLPHSNQTLSTQFRINCSQVISCGINQQFVKFVSVCLLLCMFSCLLAFNSVNVAVIRLVPLTLFCNCHPKGIVLKTGNIRSELLSSVTSVWSFFLFSLSVFISSFFPSYFLISFFHAFFCCSLKFLFFYLCLSLRFSALFFLSVALPSSPSPSILNISFLIFFWWNLCLSRGKGRG